MTAPDDRDATSPEGMALLMHPKVVFVLNIVAPMAGVTGAVVVIAPSAFKRMSDRFRERICSYLRPKVEEIKRQRRESVAFTDDDLMAFAAKQGATIFAVPIEELQNAVTSNCIRMMKEEKPPSRVPVVVFTGATPETGAATLAWWKVLTN